MDVKTRCPRCAASKRSFVRDGRYYRADDAQSVQRFKCKACGKKFSRSTFPISSSMCFVIGWEY